MAVFILAVIVNSYNTGQVRMFSCRRSPQLASPDPPDGACFPSLLSVRLRISRGHTRVSSLPAGSFSVGEDGAIEENLHLSPALCSYFSVFYLPFFITSECFLTELYKYDKS